MKIAFFGTGEFSKNILSKVYEDKNIEVALVVSQPDKPVGRDKEMLETPVKQVANELGLKILQPEKLKNNEDFFKFLKDLNLDFIVVVAYGKIVPKEVLEAPKYGCINIHGSILPKYRGASPIQESLKNGDKLTGLTIMYMSEGMDEGDVLKIAEIKVDNVDKTPDLFKKFEEIGPKLLIETLNGIISGSIKGTPQDNSKATYCKKIEKEDGEINFSEMDSDEIYNKYRAYYTWPGIYTFFEGKKLDLEDICLGEKIDGKIGSVVKLANKQIGIISKNGQAILLNKIKLAGKKSMDINSFINGNKKFLDYKFN
nr:methionyl-tRNA formyltransferase [Candidatus Gracilibacteria bacterium]